MRRVLLLLALAGCHRVVNLTPDPDATPFAPDGGFVIDTFSASDAAADAAVLDARQAPATQPTDRIP